MPFHLRASRSPSFTCTFTNANSNFRTAIRQSGGKEGRSDSPNHLQRLQMCFFSSSSDDPHPHFHMLPLSLFFGGQRPSIALFYDVKRQRCAVCHESVNVGSVGRASPRCIRTESILASVWAAARWHQTGLEQGREQHELNCGS